MKDRFSNKVVIVTGSSLGIGFAAAQGFAQEGAHVVLCARGEDKLKVAAAQITKEGGSVSYCAVDLEDTEAFAKLIEDTANEHGRLDVLVNNAAVTRHRTIEHMSLEQWRKNFCVTADATFVGTKTAMGIMSKQDQGGSIVNISSSCGSRATVGVSGYSAAKAAADSFSNCAAMEGATMGVRVNSVVPGSVVTAASQAAVAGNQQIQDSINASIPMQRSGQPEEIAAAILFLASDDASFITGIELPVDGGKLAQLYVPTTLV